MRYIGASLCSWVTSTGASYIALHRGLARQRSTVFLMAHVSLHLSVSSQLLILSPLSRTCILPGLLAPPPPTPSPPLASHHYATTTAACPLGPLPPLPLRHLHRLLARHRLPPLLGPLLPLPFLLLLLATRRHRRRLRLRLRRHRLCRLRRLGRRHRRVGHCRRGVDVVACGPSAQFEFGRRGRGGVYVERGPGVPQGVVRYGVGEDGSGESGCRRWAYCVSRGVLGGAGGYAEPVEREGTLSSRAICTHRGCRQSEASRGVVEGSSRGATRVDRGDVTAHATSARDLADTSIDQGWPWYYLALAAAAIVTVRPHLDDTGLS